MKRKHWTALAMKLSSTDIKLIHYIKHYAKRKNGVVEIDVDEFLELYGFSVHVSYFNARKSLIKNNIIWSADSKNKNQFFYDKTIC
ncbi:MAG: hypothetical protein ACTSU7_01005 [Candidatus Heimdallarchaeaceae archaeon]